LRRLPRLAAFVPEGTVEQRAGARRPDVVDRVLPMVMVVTPLSPSRGFTVEREEAASAGPCGRSVEKKAEIPNRASASFLP
jgi:hypothetical protein